MVSFEVFLGLVAAVALQRLVEVWWSRRNERLLLARGGREHAPWQMRWMTLLHGAWLVGMPLEVVVLERVAGPVLSSAALAVFVCGQLLRYAALSSLGKRWCVRVITVPGERVSTAGIYGRLRHPNYVGVCLEIAALPLVHGAWLTAGVASVCNALLLRSRILVEEQALRTDQDYAQAFG